MAPSISEQISTAFVNLGLAPAATTKEAPTKSNGAAATISSAEAVALEEQYSAHK